MAVTIPDTHRDLLQEPVHGVLTTMMPDGTPQSSIVWGDYDGEYVLINTTLEQELRKPRPKLLNTVVISSKKPDFTLKMSRMGPTRTVLCN